MLGVGIRAKAIVNEAKSSIESPSMLGVQSRHLVDRFGKIGLLLCSGQRFGYCGCPDAMRDLQSTTDQIVQAIRCVNYVPKNDDLPILVVWTDSECMTGFECRG